MSDVLKSTISGMNSAGQIRQSLALSYWARAAGPAAARSSEAIKVLNGILFIRTKSSSWSHELNMHKTELMLNLNRLLGGKVIEDIKFRTDGTKWLEVVEQPADPSLEELDALALLPEEELTLQMNLQGLESINHPRAREALAIRMRRDAKLKRWRLAHNWKVCPKCTAAHTSEYEICPICRLTRST